MHPGHPLPTLDRSPLNMKFLYTSISMSGSIAYMPLLKTRLTTHTSFRLSDGILNTTMQSKSAHHIIHGYFHTTPEAGWTWLYFPDRSRSIWLYPHTTWPLQPNQHVVPSIRLIVEQKRSSQWIQEAWTLHSNHQIVWPDNLEQLPISLGITDNYPPDLFPIHYSSPPPPSAFSSKPMMS